MAKVNFDGWAKLLALMDEVFASPQTTRSNLEMKYRSFDSDTNDHVVHLEYRFQVSADADRWENSVLKGMLDRVHLNNAEKS